VPSYALISDAEMADEETLRERIGRSTFDAVVVLRLVSVDRQPIWIPGNWQGFFYAYSGWPTWEPGYERIDTFVRFETSVYSVPGDHLIWAAASRTINPASAKSLAHDAAGVVAARLKKDHLIP
jgi:hypothetical protein